MGKQRAKIRRANLFAFPPNKNSKHDRKRTGHALGKQSTDKEEQGKNKPAITTRQVAGFQVFKVEIGENAPKEKAVERRFLTSVTHATDSTITGCTAKTAAANQAPRRPSFRSTNQNRTAFSACNATFTA